MFVVVGVDIRIGISQNTCHNLWTVLRSCPDQGTIAFALHVELICERLKIGIESTIHGSQRYAMS
jgi:hypothetical protein